MKGHPISVKTKLIRHSRQEGASDTAYFNRLRCFYHFYLAVKGKGLNVIKFQVIFVGNEPTF